MIFVILTDGKENASIEYTKSAVLKLIEDRDWTFLYLGANQDAWKEGSSIGVKYTFDWDNLTITETFNALTNATDCALTNKEIKF